MRKVTPTRDPTIMATTAIRKIANHPLKIVTRKRIGLFAMPPISKNREESLGHDFACL